MRVGTLGQNYTQQDFEEIVLLSGSDGTVLRLGDIAQVRDRIRESNLIVHHRNNPAVFVEVFRAEGEHVMDVATTVLDYVAEGPSLSPPHVPAGANSGTGSSRLCRTDGPIGNYRRHCRQLSPDPAMAPRSPDHNGV